MRILDLDKNRIYDLRNRSEQCDELKWQCQLSQRHSYGVAPAKKIEIGRSALLEIAAFLNRDRFKYYCEILTSSFFKFRD